MKSPIESGKMSAGKGVGKVRLWPMGEGPRSASAEATFEAVARATARLPSTLVRRLALSSRS